MFYTLVYDTRLDDEGKSKEVSSVNQPTTTETGNVQGFGAAHATPSSAGDVTKQKLLDTAELLFAEQGFADTSVRDITAAANCNLASINYHFGGKENLYLEVFKRALADLRDYRITRVRDAMAKDDATLETVLRAFANAFLEPLVDDSRGRLLMLLYQREMARPMLPANMFFEDLIDPITQVMFEAFDQTCPGLTQQRKQLCLNSLVGQLLFVVQCGRTYELAGRHDAPVLDRTLMVEHTVKVIEVAVKHFVSEEGAA